MTADAKSRSMDELMIVRLSGAEKRAFRRAAELNGLDLSGWVRERLIRCAADDELAAARSVKPNDRTAKSKKAASA